ncbi:MAG: heavy metal-associated domain-containing protein [Flavobacteriales bacterium]
MKIQVENIKCGGCMNSIKKALLELKGITNVEIDKDNQIVEVSGNEFSEEEVIKSLKHMGYPPAGENNVFEKAKSFVSCAVGKMQS